MLQTHISRLPGLQIVKVLGKGAFGKVKLCKDTRDGKLYALKIMDKNVLKKKRQGLSNMLQSVQKEIAIMKKLNHKNCVIMYEVRPDTSRPHATVTHTRSSPLSRLSCLGNCDRHSL